MQNSLIFSILQCGLLVCCGCHNDIATTYRCLKYQTFIFFHNSGGSKSIIQVLTALVSPGASLLSSLMSAFSLHISSVYHSAFSSLIRISDRPSQAQFNTFHLTLFSSLKVLSPNHITNYLMRLKTLVYESWWNNSTHYM